MSAAVQLRNVVIGEGSPKICVPVIGETKEEIEQAARALASHSFDLVEWRADHFNHIRDLDQVEGVLNLLRQILGDIPILFTIRTKEEGGHQSLSVEEYILLNTQIAMKQLADAIDVELSAGDDIAFVVIEAAHAAGIKVIASRHYFDQTPKKEELIMRLCKMQDMEADIVKLAVMPQNERDVLTLLDATLTMKELHAETPVVTMAMGELGVVSRIAGRVFGSAITFGTVGSASAPGQIPVEKLDEILSVI